MTPITDLALTYVDEGGVRHSYRIPSGSLRLSVVGDARDQDGLQLYHIEAGGFGQPVLDVQAHDVVDLDQLAGGSNP